MPSVAVKRKRAQPVVLATLLGAGTQSPLTQTWGAALHRTPHKRGARGRAGFGRTTRGGKRVAKGHVDKQPFALACSNGNVTLLSHRSESVSGVGLFAEQAIEARRVLGVFTGVQLSSREAARLRAGGAKCIVNYVNLDGVAAWLDGSRGRASPFTRLNSCRRTALAANVEFVCSGEQLTVVTSHVIAAGEELLADYQLGRVT
jgi:hypothetical protein